MNELTSALEAILFAAGEPVPVARISLVLSKDEAEIINASEELADEYKKNGHSLCVLKLGDKLQICTKPEYSQFIIKILEQRKPPMLSPPALETLSIVAYYQPASNAYISKIRGVDSSYMISSLVEKGLIEVKGRLDAPGRPSVYGTTDLFLRTMGISELSQLPSLPDLSSNEGIQKLQEQINELKSEKTEVEG